MTVSAAVSLILWMTLMGCSVLADPRTISGCKAAESATTYYALDNGASEWNRLLPYNPSANLAVGLIAAWILWKVLPEYAQMSDAEKVAAGAGSLLFCGAAVSNYRVGRGP